MALQKVLVVDDDENSRTIMVSIIEMMLKGKALAVSDGLEAIRVLNKESFDVVILDMRLPNIQGLDVVRSLRHMAENENVPVVAVTAFDLPWFRDEAIDAGCNHYITKPVDVAAMAKLLKEYL